MIERMILAESTSYTPECEEYVVTSKDQGAGVMLLGWLRYASGEYEFEYYSRAPYDVVVNGAMPRSESQVYRGGVVSKYLLGQFAPLPSSAVHEDLCKQCGVEFPCTNQWKLFEANWNFYKNHNRTSSDPLGDPLGYSLFWRELTRRVANA